MFFFLLFLLPVFGAVKIDIVSSFDFNELNPEWKIRCETLLDVRSLRMGFAEYFAKYYTDDVEKVLFMQVGATPEELLQIPRGKRILVIWEPGGESQSYCDLFDRVYTYNDLLIDRVQYFKFHYPVLTPICPDIPDFDRKKFCAMVSHSFTEKRADMIRFFEKMPEEDFDYFGFNPLIPTPRYRGPIPSHPVSQEKFAVLKNYKFCICFENSAIPGYITEKIFSCFAAGCIPIYWGAPNIEDYIPKDCFIDERSFSNPEELYCFLKQMTREVYEGYLSRIHRYLHSEKAHLFSAENYNDLVSSSVDILRN